MFYERFPRFPGKQKDGATQFEAILATFQYDISVLELFGEEKDVCFLGIFDE